jgi:hypothetical protein
MSIALGLLTLLVLWWVIQNYDDGGACMTEKFVAPSAPEQGVEWNDALANLSKMAAEVIAVVDSQQPDVRRALPIHGVEPGQYNATRAELSIEGQRWAEIDWSYVKSAYCIQDACGHCLAHMGSVVAAMSATAPTIEGMRAAINEAVRMVRDGRMPSPEAAHVALIKRGCT